MPIALAIRSCVTAPLEARIRPLTVPSTVVKAMAEMAANSHSPMLNPKQRGGHVAVGDIERATGHGAQAEVEGEYVEKPNRGNPHDRALPRTRFVLDRVVANQD
ncbi:MAG: hypothetical protein Ct9H300mP1_15750 [Planctomycetaceae bacterium]|nr:MAG: hypothetical protein Ct9H300mP1_15750 [Planctomycetaceae bacterium]